MLCKMKLETFLILIAAVSRTLSQCSVTTKYGTIAGKVTLTWNPFKTVCSYLGIPYASPPLGELRFKPPEPAQGWNGTLRATQFPKYCPQSGSALPGMKISEDCLYLNVFQPRSVANNPNAKLPVMLWIHGGSFTGGNTVFYTPTKLLARGNLILVVVQYRLGILGFLSTSDSNSPGNYGLKDQSFSIRWVKENIQAFGGDPEKITVFGESAGGASVMYQLVSPLNKGLLSGVISQSGGSLASWAYDPNPLESANLLATRLGCDVSTTKILVDCLRLISWEKIVEVQGKYVEEMFQSLSLPLAGITPVTEPDMPGAFITAHPQAIMESGEVDDIPVMIGANKHDGSFILGAAYAGYFGPKELDKNAEYMRDQITPDILKLFRIEDADGSKARAVELEFLSGVNRSSWDESMPGLVDIFTVFTYKEHIERTAQLLSKRGMKVYLYSFEHHSLNTFWPLFFGLGAVTIPVKAGITHADDLIYLFDFPGIYSLKDLSFSGKMLDMWLNFGMTGNPTPEASDRWQNWLSYDQTDQFYMKLNGTPTLLKDYKNSWHPNGFEWN